ncbi:peroxiredoxin [Blastochloris tepida]|uniref:Glutathione-dependent peroxiredoxin n=1 Tax=Blastochloris tepida TaxID=2233851 RepID=A0A348G4Y3_9HYPH|nr:peroxiredoxin [Blastochloris tepida]BBF94616.1 peroxiredoxin [Blastochloris tepida]
MTLKVGDRLPDVTFRVPTEDGPVAKATGELFAGKRIVLFAVPGAFTPTCHKNHLPGYLAHAADFKAKGVDAVMVTAVNDPFVMDAWEKASGAAGKIMFLADGNADFAKAAGLDLDGAAFGLGIRSKRYAMLVEDGVVKTLLIEDVPSQANQSSAEALLRQM